jgi:hypothetical protein
VFTASSPWGPSLRCGHCLACRACRPCEWMRACSICVRARHIRQAHFTVQKDLGHAVMKQGQHA